MTQDAYWTALGGPVNAQSQAILDVAQEKFNTHINTACNVASDDKLRLRSLDRAMAVSDFLEEISQDMDKAKQVLEDRAREEEEKKQAS